MRVIVVGAQGELGRSVLQGVASHKEVTDVIALFDDETTPEAPMPEVDGTPIQRSTMDLLGDLCGELRFADAVICLGWPSDGEFAGVSAGSQHDVLSHLCDSVGIVGVRVFAYVSSAAVYAPARAGERVDETWPATGATSCLEALQAAECERLIGRFEVDHPLIRVVRLRPGVIVCPPASEGRWRTALLKRLFAVANGRRRGSLVPNVEPLSIQCIEISDLVEALCLALTRSVSGIFNVAAEPITSQLLAERIGGTQVRIPPRYFLRLLTVGARLGLVSLSADRVELLAHTPDVDTTRAQHELGWVPRYSATSTVDEWIARLDPSSSRPPEMDPPATAPQVDVRSLYLASLDFFSRAVHALHDDQWQEDTDEEGLCVWQLVASVARAQYRIALAVRGYDDERIEAELPGDPLGIARADGWDLAAERGVLALDCWDGDDYGQDALSESRLAQRVAETIYETVRLGTSLWRAIGLDEETAPELLEFAQVHSAN
jgi:nucleoside-diphosphate-sugar epimerase